MKKDEKMVLVPEALMKEIFANLKEHEAAMIKSIANMEAMARKKVRLPKIVKNREPRLH